MPRFGKLSLLLVILLTAFTLAPRGEGAPPPPLPSLRILSDRLLPPALGKSVDIRWASDHSVYLAMLREGTVEASLEPLGGEIKDVVPGNNKPGGFWGSSHVGASSLYVAVAGPAFAVTWRKTTVPVRQEEAFDIIQDIDVAGDQLAILAARRDDKGNYAPDGAIGWLGSLSKGLRDLKPILFDTSGPGARHLGACGTFGIGAIRFLQDGSLLTVPGIQPGASLFDRNGKLVRTWDTVALGINADCPTLSPEQARRINGPIQGPLWLNQRTTLDDILPLQQGPALIVRRVVEGKPRWDVVLLRPSAPATWYQLPIAAEGPRPVLRGDVRGSKIALLVRSMDLLAKPVTAPRLVIAEIP